jgi:hypothetical protein
MDAGTAIAEDQDEVIFLTATRRLICLGGRPTLKFAAALQNVKRTAS